MDNVQDEVSYIACPESEEAEQNALSELLSELGIDLDRRRERQRQRRLTQRAGKHRSKGRRLQDDDSVEQNDELCSMVEASRLNCFQDTCEVTNAATWKEETVNQAPYFEGRDRRESLRMPTYSCEMREEGANRSPWLDGCCTYTSLDVVSRAEYEADMSEDDRRKRKLQTATEQQHHQLHNDFVLLITGADDL